MLGGLEKQYGDNHRRDCNAYDKHYAKCKRRVGNDVSALRFGGLFAVEYAVALGLRYGVIGDDERRKSVFKDRAVFGLTVVGCHNENLGCVVDVVTQKLDSIIVGDGVSAQIYAFTRNSKGDVGIRRYAVFKSDF